MKGFIEVTKVWEGEYKESKQLVNLNAISGVGLFENKMSIELHNGYYMFIKETYEEIKKKIEEAQEQNNGNK